MDSSIVKKELVAIIKTIQDKSGNECPEIDGATVPLDDLEKFCTKRAVLATSKLAKKLKVDIPAKDNLFFDKKTETLRSIDQIVAKICAYPVLKSDEEAAA